MLQYVATHRHFESMKTSHIALPFRAIRIGRAWWFGGKYALVGFEISVIAASICVLRGGPRAVPVLQR
jgi:hypothetical protein